MNSNLFDGLMILYMSLFGVVFFAIGALLIGFGYWMGRNSAEKPMRSINNPAKRSDKYVAPVEDPEGDLFNDAAFGEPGNAGNDEPGISTLAFRR